MDQSPEGRRLRELYYAHTAEITQLILADTALLTAMSNGLQMWEPHLQTLIEDGGHNAIITTGQVDALDAVLDALSAAGSPALQQAIADERANLPALDTFVGKTMAQARSETVGYGLAFPIVTGR